jgi:beta-glucosidase
MRNLEVIRKFPNDFIFGTATSSYQIEGQKYGNCGLSNWDSFSKKLGKTFNGDNGSEACAHILHFKKDLDLIKECGFKAYRFSFSWPRLLPDGKGRINSEGLSFYDKLIDSILEKDILPFATLYHWDLPKIFDDKGGWQQRDTCEWFSDYTDLLMRKFGDRLHSVSTINEPWCVAWLGYYWGEHAPGIKNLKATAKSMHHILLAHAKSLAVMREYNQKNLGIVLNKCYVQPIDSDEENIISAKIYDEIHNLWFDEAIFKGSYPNSLLSIFSDYMPKDYQDDLKLISKKIDWLGINYYTRSLVSHDPKEKNFKFKIVKGDLSKTDMGWEVFPEGLSLILQNTIKNYSGNLPLHITENGMANNDELENGDVNDYNRIEYFSLHLNEIYKLLCNGHPIKSYFAWSLLDNFEWSFGYEKRFGLVYVDYENQQRIPKASWYEFKKELKK